MPKRPAYRVLSAVTALGLAATALGSAQLAGATTVAASGVAAAKSDKKARR